ncbi:MAG: ribosomal protein S18-alanine N-acetyltransferase [Desulfobulbaceae bacterium]|nr:ribosomal protein S18-alanine N-acetyltransferase [Desulfobulbaceae bacterium]
MLAADAAAVAILETCSPSPWTKNQLAALPDGPYRSRLCQDEAGLMLGWTCVLPVVDEAELLKIAVLPEKRRLGVGRALLTDAFRQAADGGARRLFLEVREKNLAARLLYRQTGFTEVGRRKGYYRSPPDDALLLEKILEGTYEQSAGHCPCGQAGAGAGRF